MFIVADIGGTKMRIAKSSDLETFGEPVILGTPQDFSEGLKVFVESVKSLTSEERPERVIIGLPGILNEERHGLYRAPHLKGWEGQDFKKKLEEELNTTVYLENDAGLVGLGEAHNGAGVGYPVMAYITVSTGVGGTRIVDGEIDKSKFGFEPGHHLVAVLGKEVELEDVISGTAITKKFGVKPFEITDEAVWEDLAKVLAQGLYNIILDWSPDAIVLGGSMFKEVGIKVPSVTKYLNEINKTFPSMPILKKAELGDLGGLYGGMAYLNSL